MPTTIEEKEIRKRLHNGIYSGFAGIDNNTHGWQSGDLIILGSWPSFGKTAFALSLLKYAAVNCRVKTVLFSIETPEDHVISRLRTAYGNISLYNISIDDTPGISLTEISDRIRTFVATQGVKLVIIDYLQLINGGKQYLDINNRNIAREQELSAICKKLKTISHELSIAIIATFQMNSRLLRWVRNNSSYELSLEDFMANGVIEREADIVMLLNRRNVLVQAKDLDKHTCQEVAILKNRGNKGALVKVHYNNTLARYDDVALSYWSEMETK